MVLNILICNSGATQQSPLLGVALLWSLLKAVFECNADVFYSVLCTWTATYPMHDTVHSSGVQRLRVKNQITPLRQPNKLILGLSLPIANTRKEQPEQAGLIQNLKPAHTLLLTILHRIQKLGLVTVCFS